MCSNISIAATLLVGPSYTLKNIKDAVNQAQNGDTILLEAGVTFSGSDNCNIGLGIDLTISKTGDGADPVIDLQSQANQSLFIIPIFNNRVNLRNLKIVNSTKSSILNNGILNITNCIFSKNQTNDKGGAIFNDGALTIVGSTFNENSATNYGGAIYHYHYREDSSCTINCCRFVDNSADYGAAIANDSTVTITATNNWWGSNNPDFNSLLSGGGITYDPYITMSTKAQRKAIGATGTVTVEFASSGTTGTIPTAPITFSMTDGIVTPTQTTVIDGKTTASFIVSGSSARVCSQVDHEQQCRDVGPIIVDLYGTYTNIKAAVDTAHDGDTICITAGQTFTGTGNFNIKITKNLTFDRIGTGANPIIDLNDQGRLFDISPTYTVTMNNLEVKKGFFTGNGGAILAVDSTLNAKACTFIGNRATGLGGAILANKLNVTGCTFIENSITGSSGIGGAIYAGNGTVSCSRFAGNTAPTASAIYAGGTFTATNNWWGTNSPNSSSLFNNKVIYNPYITMSLHAVPPTIAPGGTSTIELTFSNTCIPSLPVGFNTTDGTLTCTLADTVDGKSTSTITASYSGLSFTLSATAGPEEENYSLTLTLTPSPIVKSILLTKNASATTVDRAGQLISYTYTVSNAGTVYLNNVSLTDNKVIPTFNCPNPLNPGTIATGTASYTVLQSDMDAGFIINEATAKGTTAPGDLVTVTTTQTVNAVQTPGISILKKINNSSASTQKPGVFVGSDSMMDISYSITNTGNVTLTVEITDDQGYDITPSTTILTPNASITCTSQTNAPGINQLHKNIGTATGTTTLSTVVTASASAYATSIPVNPYRFNFGCICSDVGGYHILIGSHNMPSLQGNSIDFWSFTEPSTVDFVGALDLGERIIMDSATYNTDLGMNIAVLTQTQEGDTSIILVTYDGQSTVTHSIIPLPSRAFKAQWIVPSSGIAYIVTDEQNGMSLYVVDLDTYDVTLSSSVPNFGAGLPSAFLRWYPQGNSLYVIQGYDQQRIATYKVDLTTGTIKSGVSTDLSGDFAVIHSCATCYNSLVLGGTGTTEGQGKLVRYTIDNSGKLHDADSTTINGTSVVNYCERCCCQDSNYLLVGTDNGLYSLDDELDIVASYTLTTVNNTWINTCWCCDEVGNYCIAVNNDHDAFVFKQNGSELTMVCKIE
jgi:uncharacterized repeat protein (TIGR01451 family)